MLSFWQDFAVTIKEHRNLRNISGDCKIPLDELTKTTVKTMMTYKALPEDERWTTKLIDELL